MRKYFWGLISCIFSLLLAASFAFAQPAGKAIVENACTKCHGLKKVTSAKKDIAGWETTVDRMIKKGANVPADQKDAVIKYLSTLNK